METVACELKYSGVGLASLLLALSTTLAVILAMPLPPLAHASLVLYAGASALHACRSLVSPRSLRLERSGAIHVRDDGGWRSGQMRDGSFVMPWLIVIRWLPEGKRLDRTLLLLPDMANADDMRKIRVILRWA